MLYNPQAKRARYYEVKFEELIKHAQTRLSMREMVQLYLYVEEYLKSGIKTRKRL